MQSRHFAHFAVFTAIAKNVFLSYAIVAHKLLNDQFSYLYAKSGTVSGRIVENGGNW